MDKKPDRWIKERRQQILSSHLINRHGLVLPNLARRSLTYSDLNYQEAIKFPKQSLLMQ